MQKNVQQTPPHTLRRHKYTQFKTQLHTAEKRLNLGLHNLTYGSIQDLTQTLWQIRSRATNSNKACCDQGQRSAIRTPATAAELERWLVIELGSAPAGTAHVTAPA